VPTHQSLTVVRILVLARLVTASKESTYSFVKPSEKCGLAFRYNIPAFLQNTQVSRLKFSLLTSDSSLLTPGHQGWSLWLVSPLFTVTLASNESAKVPARFVGQIV
jgi:hypothetical protein